MTVDINGNPIKFGVGLYFLGKAQKEYNVNLAGLLSSLIKNPIADMVDLMYFSAKCEAEIDEVKLNISKREFITFLEQTKDFDNTDGILAEWSGLFVKSIKGSFLPEIEDNDEISEDQKKK